MRNKLQYHRGSVQRLSELPPFLREVYRTAFEIAPKSLIDMSADRGAFVCQSQSLNLFVADTAKLNAIHFHGWMRGLKTGSYYIRTQAASNSQRFGMDIEVEKALRESEESEEACVSCSA
jgi:ribonucleoside-diphosphate reductase alpha chain